ncbi:hypothetical protein ACFX10_028493 [Malus domestica]
MQKSYPPQPTPRPWYLQLTISKGTSSCFFNFIQADCAASATSATMSSSTFFFFPSFCHTCRPVATSSSSRCRPAAHDVVRSVASSLSDMSIRKGHVVFLLSQNSIFFPIVCLAVMSLGAIITTTNLLNTTREIIKQIVDSKPVLDMPGLGRRRTLCISDSTCLGSRKGM